MKIKKTIVVLSSVLLLGSLTACDNKEKSPSPMSQPQPQVAVARVESSSQQLISTLQGRTVSYSVAEVRPQVGGILLKRLFEEGTEVLEGQPLYQIDPATYQAALESAQAELARAEAVEYQAQLTANRYAKLIKTEAISRQTYDDAQAAYKQAKASVAAAKAQLHTAQINLNYTTIRSPINGQIGRSLVTPGALLSAYQTNNLAVVQTLDPIYVDVTQASTDVLRMKKDIASGKLKAEEGKLPLNLILEDGSVYPHKGVLTLSEVTVNEGTGSITLRAQFPNPEKLLMPGMFVRAELSEGILDGALLVPQRSVMRLPDGSPYVYLVEDGKIKQQVISTQRTLGNSWLVESGIKHGDLVVTEGLQKVRPGVAVQISSENPTDKTR